MNTFVPRNNLVPKRRSGLVPHSWPLAMTAASWLTYLTFTIKWNTTVAWNAHIPECWLCFVFMEEMQQCWFEHLPSWWYSMYSRCSVSARSSPRVMLLRCVKYGAYPYPLNGGFAFFEVWAFAPKWHAYSSIVRGRSYVAAGVLLRTQGSAASSTRLFGWEVLQKAPSSNPRGKAITPLHAILSWKTWRRCSFLWLNLCLCITDAAAAPHNNHIYLLIECIVYAYYTAALFQQAL